MSQIKWPVYIGDDNGYRGQIKFIMPSHILRRGNIAKKTLEGLARWGIRPLVRYQQSDPQPKRQRRNVMWLLRRVRDLPGDCLFIEDDVDVRGDIWHWLELCRLHGRICMGYASKEKYHQSDEMSMLMWHKAHLDETPTVEPKLTYMRYQEQFWGSQCVYLPFSWVVRLWRMEREKQLWRDKGLWKRAQYKPFDVFMRYALLDQKHVPMVAWPNFAQHRGGMTLVNPLRPNHHTLSFGYNLSMPVSEACERYRRERLRIQSRSEPQPGVVIRT